MDTPVFLVAEIRTSDGVLLTTLPITHKEFKTGSRGYYASTKAEIGGKRYQVQVQLVEIGSKPRPEEKDE